MKRGAKLRFFHLPLVCAMLAALVGSAVIAPRTALAARFTISPQSGPPGTRVTVTVTDAQGDAGRRGTVRGDSQDLCTITIGNNGRGSCTFEAPNDPGTIQLKLTGPQVSNSGIGEFTVTERDNGGNGGGGNNGNNNGGNSRGNNNRGGNNDRGSIDPNRGGRELLDRLGVAPAREFGEQADRARRTVSCLISGPPFFGCNLNNDRVVPDPVDNAVRCVGGVATDLSRGLGGIPFVFARLLLGGCENVHTGPPLPEPSLTTPNNQECAFGQTSAGNCFIPASPDDGNLTLTGPAEPSEREFLPAPDVPSSSFGEVVERAEEIPASIDAPVSAPSAEMVQDQQAEIRTSVEERVDAPSAEAIRDQQTKTRNQVCASLPPSALACSR